MLIVFVSVFTGFLVFTLLYVFARKIRTQEQYQTKVRLKNLSLSMRIATPEERKSSIIMSRRDWSSIPFTERVITPIIDSVQNFFLRLAPRAIFKTIERYIILAGKQDVWNRNKVIFVWGTIIVGFFFCRISLSHKDGRIIDSAANGFVHAHGNGNNFADFIREVNNKTAAGKNYNSTAAVFRFIECKCTSGLIF